MFRFYFALAVAVLMLRTAFQVGVQCKIHLVHGKGKVNIEKNDIPAYARRMGLSIALFAMGILSAALILLYRSDDNLYSFLAFFLFALAAFLLFVRTQKRFNGGMKS